MISGELPGIGVIRGADSLRGLLQIVQSMAKLDAWSQQRPIGARLAEGHSHTTRIYNTRAADRAIELHVRVSADYEIGAAAIENGPETVLRSEARKTFVFVPRGRMAEEQ